MPLKGKGKKGKEQNDGECWDKIGESVAPNAIASSPAKEAAPTRSGGFGALDVADLEIDENEDFGGLMSAIKASMNKKNDKKNNKKDADVALDDGPAPGEGDAACGGAAEEFGASKAPVKMTAGEPADEKWGPIKGKEKGRAKAEEKDEAEESAPVEAAPESRPAPVEAKPPVDDADKDRDEQAEEGGKQLTKKEKERLKKEKEKAKKKAQAAKKKAAAASAGDGEPAAAPPPESTAPEVVAQEDDEEEEEGSGEAGGKSDKKKKKKKKPAEKEEPGPKKRGGAGISALRALMEKQRAAEEARRTAMEKQWAEEEARRALMEKREAEEEARRKEEEEQRRLEEEQWKREEEERRKEEQKREMERRKEEAKQRRKEKEKAGGEHLKEGKRLTAKQKAKEQAAEIRLQALLQSGVKIEGLRTGGGGGGGGGGGAPKKVAYGSKKNKPAPGPKDTSTVAPSEGPSSPPPECVPGSPAVAPANAAKETLAARNKNDLRTPVCCILGHVDTGRTRLLEKIRQTDAQEDEAGGITQQIGATYFSVEAIKQKTAVLNVDGNFGFKIPGLLIIDTPGHESFINLRSRGSSLCNITILVVDIMHGLEPQTLESLRLLRDKKTPFIIALNKIDRLHGWEAIPNNSFRESFAKQKPSVQREFESKLHSTIVALAEQGLKSVLYYENKNFARNVSLVPTSAITGEGVPDMIMHLVNLAQQCMANALMYIPELECTVLEVKVIEGLGTTIDVVLSNGYLREGDKIVVCGLNGPIASQVRALLTPQPLPSAYVHHKEVKAALGVKIAAPGLEKAIAGSRLLVVGPDDDEDDLKDEVMSDLTALLNFIDESGCGVCVQASTLGSLEALLEFLRVGQIPVSGINIGPVHKQDVMRSATMLGKAKELACILCLDVTVDKEAERLAEELGIRLFKADIIYHLFDAFTAYNAEIMEAKRRDAAPIAVWPCRLKILACFTKRNPIILRCDILDGSLRVGTPLCVVKTDPAGKKKIVSLGKVSSLEINRKPYETVKKSQVGAGVAVKIEHAAYESAKMFGRHFDDKDEVYSMISRQSINVLKGTSRKDVSMEEWHLIKGLKTKLSIK